MQKTTFNYLKDRGEVRVYWYGDTFIHNSGGFLNVGFLDVVADKIFIEKVPYADILFHRIGQTYLNGKVAPASDQVNFERRSITIPDLSFVEISNAFPAIETLIYLYGEREFLRQKVLIYRVDGVEYIIPAVELIRALFLHNKAMCEALMQPSGIDRLYQRPVPTGDSVFELNFSKLISSRLVNEDFAEYFAWIVATPQILNSWNSIYADMMKQRRGHTQGWGVQICLSPPSIIDCKLILHGLSQGNKFLVSEIESVGGLEYSFEELVFRHPSIKYVNQITPGEGRGNGSRSGGGTEYIIGVDGSPSAGGPDGILHPPKTFTVFKKRAKIRKDYFESTTSNRSDEGGKSGGSEGGQNDGESPKIKRTSSRRPNPFASSKLKSVEYKGLEVCHEPPDNALHDFTEAVKLMPAKLRNLEVSHSTVYLPRGPGFSQAGARRRLCGIVELTMEGKQPIFILEPERTGGNALKTILLCPLQDCGQIGVENVLTGLLRRITAYSGRILDADIESLSGAWKVVRLAHCRRRRRVVNPDADSLPGRWAERLIVAAVEIWRGLGQ